MDKRAGSGDDRRRRARRLPGRCPPTHRRDQADSRARQSVRHHRRHFSRSDQRRRPGRGQRRFRVNHRNPRAALVHLKPSDVFRCDVLDAGPEFSYLDHGSLVWRNRGRRQRPFPVGCRALEAFSQAHLDCDRIEANIKGGFLYALAVSATNYNSGKSYLFIQGKKGHPMWNRSRRVTLATKITVDHICASAAIPLVFRPVKLQTAQGTAFFGDGCIRLQQPLSPVVRLGAKRIVAIGARGESLEHQEEATDHRDPSLAQIMGVLFNVMFLDHLATDIEHLERLNQLLSDGHIGQPGTEGCEKMRPLKVLPSRLPSICPKWPSAPEGHALSDPVFHQQPGAGRGFVRRSDELPACSRRSTPRN
jgi:hypothetical protein